MNGTILLVEDNPTDEKLTLRAFDRSDVPARIDVVRDGAEALEYLWGEGKHAATELPQPSVVLLDLKLPRVDGLEVLRRLRADERTRLLPIVILTASREAEDVLRSYSLGANAYIRKPVDFAQFVDVALTIGVFWLRLNEQPPPRRIPT
jgi:two-component system response regulator